MGGLRIGLGLGLSGGVSFSPLSLFAASEPGFWFDPSDISTLFQDSAGTTPVTAAGQSVGLVLDKSKGLVLGPELVANGDFSNGSTGWTLGSGWSVSGGTANANIASGYSDFRSTSSVTEIGKTYELRFDLTVTSGGVRPFLGGITHTATITTTGSHRLVITATTAGYVAFIAYGPGGAFTGTIDNISVRELPGNHATQSTSLSRPTYQVDASGRGYLNFDGSDDSLVTPTITPGTDKAQVFAGVRKLSDAARGTVAELTASAASNNGAWHLAAPNAASATFAFESKGTALTDAIASSGVAAPVTAVVTGIADIGADTNIIRINGTQADSDSGDQGTGNFTAAAVYVGRRGGTSLPANIRLYQLIGRFGPNLTADQIAQTEAWVNSKTGAY